MARSGTPPVPATSGMYYAPGGGYSKPSPGTRIVAGQQTNGNSEPAPTQSFTQRIAQFFNGFRPVDQAHVASNLANPQADLETGITDVGYMGNQYAPLGRNLGVFRISAWQDDDPMVYRQPMGDQALQEGPIPYRLQRPWMPGLSANAGLRAHGMTQADFRLPLSPLLQTAGKTRTLAFQRRSSSYLDATNTNASRRRIPAVRVPLTPLSGG